MTTIAYRDGVIASDSCATHTTEAGGAVKLLCEKLYRKEVGPEKRPVIIGTAGESMPALIFVEWYGSGKKPPKRIKDTDFTCLILDGDQLFEADAWCVLEKIIAPFYAIGSGRKAALAAMECGKSAVEAVEIAAKFDPYTAGPFVTMRLN